MIYMYVYIYINTQNRERVYIYIYTYASSSFGMYMYVDTYMIYIYTHTHKAECVYIYIYEYTYISKSNIPENSEMLSGCTFAFSGTVCPSALLLRRLAAVPPTLPEIATTACKHQDLRGVVESYIMSVQNPCI